MAKSSKVPTLLPNMYQPCDCQPRSARKARPYCYEHVTHFNYKPRGKARVRVSCDDLTPSAVRKFTDVCVVLTAFKKRVDDGLFIQGRKLAAGQPTIGEAMDDFVESYYAGGEMIIIPPAAGQIAKGEVYLDWLMAELQDCINDAQADPELRMRAKKDRARLCIPRRIRDRWANKLVAELTLDDGRELMRELHQRAKFFKQSRKAKLRAVGTIKRFMRVLLVFGKWLAKNGPAKNTRYIKSSPFVEDGETQITFASEDNTRTTIISPELEVKMLASAKEHYPEIADIMVTFSIDSMMRRNSETRRIRVGDLRDGILDGERYRWIEVKGTHRANSSEAFRAGTRSNKTAKTREVPISDRMAPIVDAHLFDKCGRRKGPDEYLLCDGTGERPIGDWYWQWQLTVLRAHDIEPEWATSIDPVTGRRKQHGLSEACVEALQRIDVVPHDCRATMITRLLAQGMPESQVGKIAGNPSSIKRYNRQQNGDSFRNALRFMRVSAAVVNAVSTKAAEGESGKTADAA